MNRMLWMVFGAIMGVAVSGFGVLLAKSRATFNDRQVENPKMETHPYIERMNEVQSQELAKESRFLDEVAKRLSDNEASVEQERLFH